MLMRKNRPKQKNGGFFRGECHHPGVAVPNLKEAADISSRVGAATRFKNIGRFLPANQLTAAFNNC